MSRGKRVTYEERVEKVEEVLKKYPHASRSQITMWTGYKGAILDEMYERGIKIPDKKKPTSRSTSWMKTLGGLSGR